MTHIHPLSPVHTAALTLVFFFLLVVLFWVVYSVETGNREATADKIDKFFAKLRGAVRSRTIWVNGLVLAFVQQIPYFIDYLSSSMPALQPMIPANHYTFALEVIAIVNLVLRFRTGHPLEAK